LVGVAPSVILGGAQHKKATQLARALLPLWGGAEAIWWEPHQPGRIKKRADKGGTSWVRKETNGRRTKEGQQGKGGAPGNEGGPKKKNAWDCRMPHLGGPSEPQKKRKTLLGFIRKGRYTKQSIHYCRKEKRLTRAVKSKERV